MKFSIETPEEFNTLTKIIKRTCNLDKIMMNFEFNIDINEETLEPKVEELGKELNPTFNELFFEAIRKLENGKCFFFGSYKGVPIKWIKVSKYRAISAYILDNMAFGDNNNYATSKVREWCNSLGAEYEINEDGIYIPSEKEIIRWFPTDEERMCDYSEEAKERGIDDGEPWYWLRNAIQGSSSCVRYVSSSGSFSYVSTRNSYIGVRPVLKIEV